MSEQSAIQAIALRTTLRIADEALNPDGGAIARGHALGAAGAVLVVRLFTRMVRMRDEFSPRQGVAVLGASGGQGVAALFNAA
jgi:acetyl-CoA C-acetyltransferase